MVKALYDKRARGEKEHDSLALHYRWLGSSWKSALYTGRLVHSTTLHADIRIAGMLARAKCRDRDNVVATKTASMLDGGDGCLRWAKISHPRPR